MTVPRTENAVTGLPKNMIDNQMRMARFTVLATECVTGEMRICGRIQRQDSHE